MKEELKSAEEESNFMGRISQFSGVDVHSKVRRVPPCRIWPSGQWFVYLAQPVHVLQLERPLFLNPGESWIPEHRVGQFYGVPATPKEGPSLAEWAKYFPGRSLLGLVSFGGRKSSFSVESPSSLPPSRAGVFQHRHCLGMTEGFP